MRRLIRYLFFPFFIFLFSFFICQCVSGPKITELENKGTVMGVKTPDWLRIYLDKGTTALQALPEFKDKYCIIGEESGVNRQFVLAWADQASAQQRIGSLIRTNIASRYSATINATAQSGSVNASQYQQQIDTVLNAVVNVSYSGAQREADWWSLRRSYDPDNKEVYKDEYTAWVLYTIPKTELNRQVALAMETAIRADSPLYDITIALARDILLQGYDENEIQNAVTIQKTASDNYNPPGSTVALALDEIGLSDKYFIGRSVAANILSSYKLSDNDPALVNYLNMICNALAINSPQPSAYNGYSVAVLDSDEVNAFATPGGHIFVTRALVNFAKSEDALAAVIAHELAHIQLNHGLRAIQEARDLDDWLNQFTQLGVDTVASRLNAGFSRTQEFDADITALSLLAAAGYNVQGLVDILKELEKTQGGIRGGFNDTHPSPASRLVNATVAAARYANMADNGSRRQDRFSKIVK